MKKRGRPQKEIVSDSIIAIRMTNEEHQKLKNYAESHQMTITETVKAGVGLLYKEDK